MKLSAKQKKFCEEYLIDLNGTQAAIRAGYSGKTANRIASRLLTKVDLQNYIQEQQKTIRERNKITIDELVQTLAEMVRFDIADLYNEDGSLKKLNEMSVSARKCISDLQTAEMIEKGSAIGLIQKVKTYNKQEAIEKLMKHLGGYERDNEQKKQDGSTVIILPSNNRDDRD